MSVKLIEREARIKVPKRMKATQEWFGAIISSPLDENDVIRPIAPSGALIADEAPDYIVPSPTLLPHQRIEVYNQQYWWRLLRILEENFPLVARLFGSHAFRQTLAVPFLVKYRPNDWSLISLGEKFPQWILEDYHEADQSLVYHCAKIDLSFALSFISLQKPRLNLSDLLGKGEDEVLDHPLCLQPHIYLFCWDYDLFSFRKAFLEEKVDFWIEHPFPQLLREKTYHFVLFRTHQNMISWRDLSEGEFFLLGQFKEGKSINQICELIESKEKSLREEIEENLQKWLQEWAQWGWFAG